MRSGLTHRLASVALVGLALLVAAAFAQAQDKRPLVYVAPIEGIIDLGLAPFVHRLIAVVHGDTEQRQLRLHMEHRPQANEGSLRPDRDRLSRSMREVAGGVGASAQFTACAGARLTLDESRSRR